MGSVFIERSQSGERAMTEIEAGCRQRSSNDVQHMELGAFGDACRQAFVGQTRGELGDLLRNAGIRSTIGSVLDSRRGRIHEDRSRS
jgi:hypothetical protein